VVEEEDSQMEEVEFDGPMQIMELMKSGIAENDIKKLMEAGYHTVESVVFTPRKALILVKGLSEAKLDKILDAC
jgi:DNA repair protein RAD51